MKRFISYLLLLGLAILSAQGLFSCRIFKKSRARADSTVVRSETRNESWSDELVTEMIIEPGGQRFTRAAGMDYPSIFAPDYDSAKAPPAARRKGRIRFVTDQPWPQDAKVTIRQTQRSQGQKSSSKEETKTISTADKAKTREPDQGTRILVGLSVLMLAIVAFIIYHLRKRH